MYVFDVLAWPVKEHDMGKTLISEKVLHFVVWKKTKRGEFS